MGQPTDSADRIHPQNRIRTAQGRPIHHDDSANEDLSGAECIDQVGLKLRFLKEAHL